MDASKLTVEERRWWIERASKEKSRESGQPDTNVEKYNREEVFRSLNQEGRR